MKVVTSFFLGILALLRIVSGSLCSGDLKFCIFAGDFEISPLAGSIKKRSERMMFSVAVNFEQLSDFLLTVGTRTTIVTSQRILITDEFILKRSNLLWVAIPDLKNSSPEMWDFYSPKSPSYSAYENDLCQSSITVGVVAEEGLCDNMTNKELSDKTNCYHYQLMDMLGQRFNFTTKIAELEDKRYPYIFPNGTLSGLFRMIPDQNVDASCGSFIVTRRRLDIYRFLWPTFSLGSKMYLKREEKHDSWWYFLKPFEKDVWAAIIAYLMLSAFIRYIIYRFLHTLKEIKTSLYSSFLFSLQIFCNQGSRDIPNNFSVRLVHFLGLLAIIILYPVYSASVVSFLTIKVPRLPFHDFEGFVADDRYTLLTPETSFMAYYFYFESSKDFIGKRENLLADFNNLPKTTREGMKRVCDGKHLAYADYELALAVLINELECEVIEVPDPILFQYMGIIIKETMPCQDRLANGLLYLRSIGIIERMQSKMVPEIKSIKLRAVESELHFISITDIYPYLVLHALGLLAALIIFLLEIFTRKKYSKYNRRKCSHELMARAITLWKQRYSQERQQKWLT